MSKRLLLVIAVLAIGLSVPTANAQSRDTQIVGVITKVEPKLIEVRADNCQTTSIVLTDSTKVKPWNREARGLSWPAKVPNWQPVVQTDVQSLTVGTRVHIDATSDARPTARVVWIVGA